MFRPSVKLRIRGEGYSALVILLKWSSHGLRELQLFKQDSLCPLGSAVLVSQQSSRLGQALRYTLLICVLLLLCPAASRSRGTLANQLKKHKALV
ncbi:hypothetical protein M378DRAFT_356314 [Amanita muscaria Koide BX008]|uniref:Uncharacterized protein n=1 Tax=Amanita muscaria (strain Koide BX008) TaxID=946122 RepID=A0A0C2WMP2_AMAMK|nr:hypothetical protein M378DRAFT_356314 [Amanita muscaria Koide BX008]